MDKKQITDMKKIFTTAKNNLPGAILLFISFVITQIPTCHAIIFDTLDNKACEVKNESDPNRRNLESSSHVPAGTKKDNRGTEEDQKG